MSSTAKSTATLVKSLPPLDLQQRYSVEEAAAYLRQSRAKTYQDIAAGRLQSFTDGRRRYINGRAIAARSEGRAA